MMMLKMTNRQKDSVERYRRIFPDFCADKDDVQILLYRKVITENEALLMKTPKPKKARAPREPKPKVKRIRPYTSNQISKMCRDAMKDYIADYICGNNPTEDQIESREEGAAYDMAESMLMFDERMQEYFRRSGVQRKYWIESLADYFIE